MLRGKKTLALFLRHFLPPIIPYSQDSEGRNAASAAARTQLRGNGICQTSRAKGKSKHRQHSLKISY